MRLRRAAVTDGTPEGFPRWAWWAVFLATFTFAVPIASPWWSTVLRGEIPDAADENGEEPASTPTGGVTPIEDPPGSMMSLTLRVRRSDGTGLDSVPREIPYVRGVLAQIQATISALTLPNGDAPPLLPEGARVLDVAFTKSGTLFVDFSTELDSARVVGPEEERELAEGIVTTVTANFAAVRRVVILVDGKAPQPFHLDLTRPLRADDPLFAAEPEPEPEASPSPEAAPSPSPSAP